jgi:meso-butanediol dehydrogenase/(S,S)-butanediol dehydrogenase/diacetyl reductase
MGVIVVTGSASGIGASAAAALGASGFEVVGWDLASPHPVDVANEAEVRAAAEGLSGQIDGAVLAAGVSRMARLVDTTTADWDDQMRVNAFGVFNTMRALIPMVRPGGSIVAVASVAGLRSAPLLSAYCASKFAVIALVQAAAVELGPVGIRVNAVCPMYVRTPMEEREIGWEAAMRGISPEEVMAGYINGTPLGRVAEPADIADVIGFLISDRSRYMTGASVTISGGADLL